MPVPAIARPPAIFRLPALPVARTFSNGQMPACPLPATQCPGQPAGKNKHLQTAKINEEFHKNYDLTIKMKTLYFHRHYFMPLYVNYSIFSAKSVKLHQIYSKLIT